MSAGRFQPGTAVAADQVEITDASNLKIKMVALKRKIKLKEINGQPQSPGKSLKTKFGIYGQEIIEKEVKPAGNSGRVYLPLDWVGKHVKIVRVD